MLDVNIEIMVIGAGGTGGTYLKELARFLYSLPQEEQGLVSVSIVDGDRVEERNISRQPFQQEDVGEYKAVAMCEAIQEVFGLKRVTAFPEYIENVDRLHELWYSNSDTVDYTRARRKTIHILVGCVDNHHARKIMHDYFKKHPKDVENLIYLDSANEFYVGEIVIGAKFGRTMVAPDRVHYYPKMFKGKLKSASELSCLELNEVAPQHIITNMMAANILLSQTALIMQEGKVNGGIVLFDAALSSSKFIPYTKEGK